MSIRALIFLFSAFGSLFAAAADPVFVPSAALLEKQAAHAYIVQLRDDPISSYQGGIAGMAATRPAAGDKIDPRAANVRSYFDYLASQHDQVLADVGVSEKLHSYCYSFNGFAAKLTSNQLTALRDRDDVIRIWRDELRQPQSSGAGGVGLPQTDNSAAYLGLNDPDGPWADGLTGEDIVIGIIDSGVWPEHPSFADVPTPELGDSGDEIPYGAPPASWNGTDCAFGNAAFNPLDASFTCNNKLLGASFFADSFLSASPLIDSEYLSARDNDGHGSHVGATAGGNNGVAASIGGETLGTVSGMAPRARIAVYKVCWNGSLPPAGFLNGCYQSDSMAAIDQAVADGVDVINYSIGGASTVFGGPDDLAFLFAADAGVFVATSQGNAGPEPGTTGTPAGVPWLTAVASIQDDQVFNIAVDITSETPGLSAEVEAIEADISVPLSDTGPVTSTLMLADDGTAAGVQACNPLVNGADVAGNIALIQRGACNFSTKILNAQAAGAVGVIVYNNNGDPIVMGGSNVGITLPAVMIGQSDGETIADGLTSGAEVAATMSDAILISKAGTVATTSSRGPNSGSPDIIKPDIAAPGVQILAAQTPTPNDGQAPGELFQFLNGTSMSSPHIAGIGALLAQANPDWSPETVRSALMTTATQNLKKTFGDDPADPFDIGAGLVSPEAARNPGLVYQENLLGYIRFLCGEPRQSTVIPSTLCDLFGAVDPSDLNLPSIGVAELAGIQTVPRTVTNVLGETGTFEASFDAPAGVDIEVVPDTITLGDGESATYSVNFTATGDAVADEWSFGQLTWDHTASDIQVTSPLAIRPVAASFPEEVRETDVDRDGDTSFGVTIGVTGELSTGARGLTPPIVQRDEVAEGGATLHFFTVPAGTRLARFSLFDESVGDGTGSDDLDMQVLGPGPGFPFIALSGSATSEEQVDLVDPAPGDYAVFVIHFATVNPVTDYALHSWSVGPNEGNVSIDPDGTAPVTVGDIVAVDVDWTGLTLGTKYRGLVEIGNADGPLGFTVLSIDTTAPAPGDANGDGVVDIDDVMLILAARGQTVPPADESLDLDGDGVITMLDARLAVLNCTNPRCSR